MRGGFVFLLAAGVLPALSPSYGQSVPQAERVHAAYPDPVLPYDFEREKQVFDDSLAAAIAEAYAHNPELAARRYDLRSSDDEIGIALSQGRPSAQVQITGGYNLTLPGDTTQASRPLSDRLNRPNIESNSLTSQLEVDQPLWTGGRASSAVNAAMASSLAGREVMRGAEGDVLLNLLAAYVDVRRDTQTLAIRWGSVAALTATLEEITARREAGDLTRTDMAQGEVQLQSAKVQLNIAEAQLQASRAAFAAIVGRAPGNLAPEGVLPSLPRSLDDALARAEARNPDLAAAIANERASQARIAAAKSEGAPILSLRGTAGTSGVAVPFYSRDQDINFTGQATLTIPLLAGGRVRAQVAQAENRNIADGLRIEAQRRRMVQALVNAWNQWAVAERNINTQKAQLRAASIYYEGAYAEYREGLRSTFDVLYAQNSVREAQIALLASERDAFLAQASLLRQTGELEAGVLLEGAELYDPALYADKAYRRSSMPWDGIIRKIDRIAAPDGKRKTAEEMPLSLDRVKQVPSAPVPPPNAVTERVSHDNDR